MSKFILLFLIFFLNFSCGVGKIIIPDEKTDSDKYVSIVLYQYLIGSASRCPTTDLTLEKGINYAQTINPGKTLIFNISSKDNIPPPNQNRNYYLVVTKDATSTIEFLTQRLCDANSRSPEITFPESSTATELRFRLESNDVKTLSNAFYLRITSGNSNISIKQE